MCVAIMGVLTVAGCGDSGSPGSSAPKSTVTTVVPPSGENDGSSSQSSSATSEADTGPIDDDHSRYSVGSGKHVFRLPGGGGCWFNPNEQSRDGENMLCDLTITGDRPPVVASGTSEPPNAVTIDRKGAKLAADLASEGLPGGVLEAGHRLTVGGLSCTVTGAKAMTCSGPNGEFTYDSGTVTITRGEQKTDGAGTRCGQVRTKNGTDQPVAITEGAIACRTAMETAKGYMESLGSAQGQAMMAEVGEFHCSHDIEPGRSRGDSRLKCHDDDGNALAIGE